MWPSWPWSHSRQPLILSTPHQLWPLSLLTYVVAGFFWNNFAFLQSAFCKKTQWGFQNRTQLMPFLYSNVSISVKANSFISVHESQCHLAYFTSWSPHSLLKKIVCVCDGCMCLWRPEEDHWSPRAEVTWGCEVSDMYVKNQTQFLSKNKCS